MNSKTDEPKIVLADSKKIEGWAGLARYIGILFVLVFIVFFVLVISGTGKKPSVLPPMGMFILAFCVAFILGLVAKLRKAIEDLQERVSELEKR